MLVKKMVQRTNGRSQIPGTRNRGCEQGDSNQGRSRGELNQTPQFQESAPNTATAQQQNNLSHDQNLGSRIRALATIDLNASMETHELESVVERETVSNGVTNTDLVTKRHMKTRDLEEDRHGSSNLQGRDFVPRGRNPEPTDVAQYSGARELRRPDSGMYQNVLAQSSARGPAAIQLN